MSQTLTSEVARKSLDVLLERVERQPDFSPEEARELLVNCEIAALVLGTLWKLAQGVLDRGMEGGKLTLLLKEFVDLLDLGIKVFDTASEKVKAAELPAQERAEGLSLLERSDRHAGEMRNELSALLAWIQTPPRDVAPSSLPGRSGEQTTKGYLGLDELKARLLSGGGR